MWAAYWVDGVLCRGWSVAHRVLLLFNLAKSRGDEDEQTATALHRYILHSTACRDYILYGESGSTKFSLPLRTVSTQVLIV